MVVVVTNEHRVSRWHPAHTSIPPYKSLSPAGTGGCPDWLNSVNFWQAHRFRIFRCRRTHIPQVFDSLNYLHLVAWYVSLPVRTAERSQSRGDLRRARKLGEFTRRLPHTRAPCERTRVTSQGLSFTSESRGKHLRFRALSSCAQRGICACRSLVARCPSQACAR